VVIDTAASDDPEALAADLRALGAYKVTVFGRMVSAVMPTEAIPSLNGLSSLQLARSAPMAKSQGTVTSQGDKVMRSDIARASVGVDGTGVMVGTISDSYNCFGTAADGVASGDLPAGILVVEEGPCIWMARDEGRAMMEVITDVAPGVRHAFATAHYGQANFAKNILALAGVGANVINDDITYLFEPFYQDGVIAQAVDLVKARGVSYFSAAGNDARQSYEAPFRPSGEFIDEGHGLSELHDFDPGPGVDTCMKYTVPPGNGIQWVYQWDQPFFSISGPPGSASDMDLSLVNINPTTNDCDSTEGSSGPFEPNIGRDPLESLDQIDLVRDKFGMRLLHRAGPRPGRMKVVATGPGSISLRFDEFGTSTGALWGHSGAQGGLGVGAAIYQLTPEFGTSPPRRAEYSSFGGSPILFDTKGRRLAKPQVRRQPAIVAPTGVDTTFFGGTLDGSLFPQDTDGNGLPNFHGTSAAAPHAAGVAALLKSLVPSITTDRIYDAMKSTAIDMDSSGFDFGTGFGLIQADAAVEKVAPPGTPDIPDTPETPDVTPVPPGTPGTPENPGAEPGIPGNPEVPAPDPEGPGEPEPTAVPGFAARCMGLRATIIRTNRSDRIVGTRRRDVIHGLAGNDVIYGLRGNDIICGGPGRDRRSGGRQPYPSSLAFMRQGPAAQKLAKSCMPWAAP